ncbi:hypothetical protein QTI66_23315 [Variovorax sp. J22R133]|uniref:hypothetical protein n=1 Tax=Variovorax brevis TaxID=3053503 RepID=UPI0025764A16|nr:hypothetical protein [Variovorax sp. J22R133]MDM0115098.1 hypothetical protein [Variovorax sp. J22R133]
MRNEVVTYFEECVDVFKTFDGPEIARRYLTPYSALRQDGAIKYFDSAPEMASHFQSMMDDYLALGVRACRYKDLELMPLGTRSALATVTWELCRQDDTVVSFWRESYILVRTADGLRVFASVDHAL